MAPVPLRCIITNIKSSLLYLFLKVNSSVFLTQSLFSSKPSTSLLCYPTFVGFFSIHAKLSSPFFSFKLTELFSYETPLVSQPTNNLCYTFTSVNPPMTINLLSYKRASTVNTPSISSIFSSSTWLERELTEMSNVTFSGKSDTRNLMLPYGDSSSPLQKSLPSIGLREIFYDSSTDAILTRPVSIQY